MPEKNGFIFFRQFAFVSVFGSKTECNAGENPENPLRIKSGYGNLRLFSKQFRFFGKKIEKTQKNRNPFLKNPKRSHHWKNRIAYFKKRKTESGFFPSLKNGIRSGPYEHVHTVNLKTKQAMKLSYGILDCPWVGLYLKCTGP